jgi:hypothetical protein
VNLHFVLISLLRFLQITIGYAVTLAWPTALDFFLTVNIRLFEVGHVDITDTLQWSLMSYPYLLKISILPTLIFVVICEWQRLTKMWYYLLAASFISLFLFFIITPYRLSEVVRSPATIVVTLITIILIVFCGAASGLVYWFIAGRYAGLWRDAKAGNQH